MMLTRCPACTTTFRVTPEQVKARHGKVRCGRCQHVFDAIEFMVDAAVAAPAAVVKAEALVSENSTPTTAPPQVIAPPVPAIVVESVPTEPVVIAPTEIAEVSAAPNIQVSKDTKLGLLDDDVTLTPSPLSGDYAPNRKIRVPNWPWTLGILLVLLALSTQIMLAYRTTLVVKYPALRPALEMLCGQAQCTIELPSNPDLVSIDASDLHPGRNNGLELTATLRNRAPYAQTWPFLELTLTDGADKPIVRKVLTPAQYLPATQAEAAGFPADGELAVQLTFDTGNLPAAGYRLYLFYP